MVLTANDAKALSNKNGRDEKVQKPIKQVEKRITEACEKGNNHICFGAKEEYGGKCYYIDGKSERVPEVRQHFINQGFTFKDTGYISGVYQHTEDIFWWLFMNDSDKIKEIKRVFKRFHEGDEDLDTIDVCIKIEDILKR